VVGGGPAVAGAQLEYLVRVTNISLVPALYVVITDDLAMPVPGYLTLVDQSVTMNGSTAGISVAGSLITADYSTEYGPLQPAQSIQLRFRAVIAPNLAIGTRITNTGVVTWNQPPQTASASVSIDVGGITGVGILNGTAWHDANFNGTIDVNERLLEGWTVELYRNAQLTYSALTDASGVYRISGVAPNYATADKYELRFLAPGAGPNTAKLGRAQSIFTNDLQRIADIVVQPGSNLQNLNLPIEPNGVVYNTISRTPIPGAVLRMLQAGNRAALPESCFYDPAQQNQVTLASGYYRFDINFSDPACASGGNYLLDVTAPASGYVAGYSQIIPPVSDPSTGPFSVPACPGSPNDAIPATAQRCEVQVSEFAPSPAVRPRTAGTNYHVHLTLDDSFVPGSSQIFNNHIPLDPQLNAALAITKTTPLLNVTRGQLVPYTITVRNTGELPLLQDVRVVDRFPAGFRYVEGSARIDNVPTEPTVAGRELVWSDLTIDRGEERTIMMLLAVGAGVGEGEFVNRAQADYGITGAVLSGEATATVRVVPDPTFDCTDVTGKVFNDVNRNGFQDAGEQGLPGIRLVTARGLTATTDAYGRYHITCAITPIEGRGSNFVLKLDDRTLPSGYRSSTQPVRVERATRGKALKMNFGASIYRVVSLDLADAVFEPGTTEMRLQWQPRIQLLLEELRKSPSVLRLSYLAEVEDAQLVEQRLNAVKQEVQNAWKAMDSSYQLTIEPEVFWRLGSPPKQSDVRERASR
jgi:large repetitive protein